jgi:GNAT superfamily N-acetyltransferase
MPSAAPGADTAETAGVSLVRAHEEDFEELVALRLEAMRESLERIGRWDAQRARERFHANFVPELTHHILLHGKRVGFVAVRRSAQALALEHLYVRPGHQGQGVGAAVLALLFREADARRLPVRVGALRGSDSNRFYLRYGFSLVEESEWDLYYSRPAAH